MRLDFEYESCQCEESFRFVRGDYEDPQAPFDLYLVRPQPPVTTFQGTVGTILIVQHPLPDHAACVITSILGSLLDARIVETARSLETLSSYDLVVRESGHLELCRQDDMSPFHLCDLRI